MITETGEYLLTFPIEREGDSFGLDGQGRMSIRLTLPMPPSDNKIYWNNPYGGRTLNSTAKKYKREVKDQVAKLILRSGSKVDFQPCVEYEAIITIYFDEIEFKTWGDKNGALTRYKKLDAGNRQKLIIDSVMGAIGIDDRHIFREVLRKRVDAADPRVAVIVREMNPR
jgi:Holliday junction resolvase RusA-like endonuclease